jgi:Holliday junction resolvasome RuvABC endonuclease subunit
MTKIIKTAGIDYSLTSPAICFDNRFFYLGKEFKTWEYKGWQFESTKYPTYECEEERHHKISLWATGIIVSSNIDSVYIEDYAFGAKGRIFNIGENTGHLKHELWRHGVKFSVVAPTQIKKFATGKGNADKQAMFDAFTKLVKVNLQDAFEHKILKNPVTDIIDAYYISRYGESINKGEVDGQKTSEATGRARPTSATESTEKGNKSKRTKSKD